MPNILNFILALTPLIITKWFLVVGLIMYSAFAGIIVRQVGVMSESIEDPFNGVVTLMAWLHLGLAIFLVITCVALL